MFWRKKENIIDIVPEITNEEVPLNQLHIFTVSYGVNKLSGISIEAFEENHDIAEQIIKTFTGHATFLITLKTIGGTLLSITMICHLVFHWPLSESAVISILWSYRLLLMRYSSISGLLCFKST
jgi:hypothetical protein